MPLVMESCQAQDQFLEFIMHLPFAFFHPCTVDFYD